MSNLLKMERYQLSHNFLYRCSMIGIFLIGFFIAETYVPEVMGTAGKAAASLADIFNGMVYDSTFLLILMSSILALILGQEFSCRTVDLEIAAGHSRKAIFFSKAVTYLIAFNVMALVYPLAGCIREFSRFGLIDAESFIYQIVKAVLYSLLLNSAAFSIAIWICFCLRNSAKAIAVTAVTTFVLSLYLGFGMMLKFPVAFLPTYQIREAVSSPALFQPLPILIGTIWAAALLLLSWYIFRKCELK